MSLRRHSAIASIRSRRRHRAFVALGSNVGDRVDMIEGALKDMQRRGIEVKRTSSLWETDAMYVVNQDRFLNGVCEVSEFQVFHARAGLILPGGLAYMVFLLIDDGLG